MITHQKMSQAEWAEFDRILEMPETQAKLRSWMIENGVVIINGEFFIKRRDPRLVGGPIDVRKGES